MGAGLPPPQQIVCHSHWTMNNTKVCVFVCVCVSQTEAPEAHYNTRYAASLGQ